MHHCYGQIPSLITGEQIAKSRSAFCGRPPLICYWDLINLNPNKHVLMGKIKREPRKWKENKFVNWAETKIAVLSDWVIYESCKHRCCNTESFFTISEFLSTIIFRFHRSNEPKSKLAEVQRTFSLQIAVCVCSWLLDNCHYQAYVLFIVKFKGFPGIVGKTVAITTYHHTSLN